MLKRAGAPSPRTRPRNSVHVLSLIVMPVRKSLSPWLARARSDLRSDIKPGGAFPSGVEMKGPGFLQRTNPDNTGMA